MGVIRPLGLIPTVIRRGNRSEPYRKKARKIDIDAETRRF